MVLEWPYSHRKINRASRPRHVGVAIVVHGDAVAYVVAVAVYEGEITDHRINDQRSGRVIRGYRKADLLGIHSHVAPRNDFPTPINLLIDYRWVRADLAPGGVEYQLPLGIDIHAVSACKAQRNLTRIRARGDLQVVFELPLRAMVDQVDARIDVGILHLGIVRHVGAP